MAALCLAALCASAQDHLAERMYITTDKSCYVAGESIWCSAFCVDASTGTLSEFSSISYVELHSTGGMAATAKIALRGGRGAGRLEIPVTAPTGNYVLIAYTAQNVNEDGFDCQANARTVSVFNTLTSERVPGGVEVVDALPDRPSRDAGDGSVTIRPLRNGTFSVTNTSGEDVTLSVSLYCDDSLVCTEAGDIRSFATRADVGSLSFSDRRIPEYDGEIVYGRVAGADPSRLKTLEGKFAFISVPGDRSDTYSCQIASDGSATFFTNNLYGDKDLVCQIEDADAGAGCHLEIDSPFVNFDVKEIPALRMSSSMASDLRRRSAGMQIEKLFSADTLYERLPVRDNLLFGAEGITYVLDDYTRLPLMEECIVEFISELRARRIDGKRDLQVRMQDLYRSSYFANGASLMMVDGVPVFDHETIYRYDPLLVETVNIYPYTYFIGTRGYSGVVNFVTYKRNLPSVTFPDNVRIMEFQGASFPMAYTCAGVSDEYPDYRNTLYWDPLVDLPVNGSRSFEVHLPAYDGHWRIVVEGLTASGRPVYASHQ